MHRKNNVNKFESARVLLKSHVPFSFHSMDGFHEWFDEDLVVNNPLVNHYGIIREGERGTHVCYDVNIASPLIPHLLSNQTVPELVAAAFGKTRVRKDLVKAIANTDLRRAEVAWAARGIVPTDWIVSGLNDNRPQDNGGIAIASDGLEALRIILKKVRPSTQKKILSGVLSDERNSRMYLRDIYRYKDLINEIPPEVLCNKEVKSLRNAHDAIVRSLRGRGDNGKVITGEIKGFKKEIHEKQIKDMQLVVADSSTQLIDWGSYMHNCIGSYARQVEYDNRILAGVLTGDQLVANIELARHDDKWQLKQLLGKYNANLPESKRKPLENFFESKGVDVKQYWGK